MAMKGMVVGEDDMLFPSLNHRVLCIDHSANELQTPQRDYNVYKSHHVDQDIYDVFNYSYSAFAF